MALYAGETVRIRLEATDYDGTTPLTDADVDAFVTIWDRDGSTVLVDAAMTWAPDDPEGPAWHHDWDTPATAGSYRAKLAVGAGTRTSWEFKTIRLRPNPA